MVFKKNTRFRPVGAQSPKDGKRHDADAVASPAKEEGTEDASERFVAKPGDFRKLGKDEKVTRKPGEKRGQK